MQTAGKHSKSGPFASYGRVDQKKLSALMGTAFHNSTEHILLLQTFYQHLPSQAPGVFRSAPCTLGSIVLPFVKMPL